MKSIRHEQASKSTCLLLTDASCTVNWMTELDGNGYSLCVWDRERANMFFSVSSVTGWMPVHKLLWPEYMKLLTLVLFNKLTQFSETKQERTFIIYHRQLFFSVSNINDWTNNQSANSQRWVICSAAAGTVEPNSSRETSWKFSFMPPRIKQQQNKWVQIFYNLIESFSLSFISFIHFLNFFHISSTNCSLVILSLVDVTRIGSHSV